MHSGTKNIKIVPNDEMGACIIVVIRSFEFCVHSLNQPLPYNMLMFRKNQPKQYIIVTNLSTYFCREKEGNIFQFFEVLYFTYDIAHYVMGWDGRRRLK